MKSTFRNDFCLLHFQDLTVSVLFLSCLSLLHLCPNTTLTTAYPFIKAFLNCVIAFMSLNIFGEEIRSGSRYPWSHSHWIVNYLHSHSLAIKGVQWGKKASWEGNRKRESPWNGHKGERGGDTKPETVIKHTQSLWTLKETAPPVSFYACWHLTSFSACPSWPCVLRSVLEAWHLGPNHLAQ